MEPTQFQNFYYYPREFDDELDSLSPPSPEDPDLVPILDREDNSDLSRPDSSISSYSSSIDSLRAFGDQSLPRFQPPQKYQFPRAPPPSPFFTSPQVSPLKHGLGDDRELYAAPFILSASLLELKATPGNLFAESEEEYRSMEESTYIPFEHKHKHIPESWSLPCSFDEPTRYAVPKAQEYETGAYSHRLRASIDGCLLPAVQLPYAYPPATYATESTPPPPPPSRCSSAMGDPNPWLMSEIEGQLRVLHSEQIEAEKAEERDELTNLEKPSARRPHRGTISKLSRAWKGYLHRP